MQELPIPCPGHLIPDATDAFDAAYRAAKAQRAVFVAIEREGQHWTVKADALTAGPGHTVDEAVNGALRAAIVRLVNEREAGSDAYEGPVYFTLHGVPSEERARELAAAFHGRPVRRPGNVRSPAAARTRSGWSDPHPHIPGWSVRLVEHEGRCC